MSPYINGKNRENIRKKISLPNGSTCAEIDFFNLTEKAIPDAHGHLLEATAPSNSDRNVFEDCVIDINYNFTLGLITLYSRESTQDAEIHWY